MVRLLATGLVALLAIGCITRPAKVPVFKEGGIEVFLRSDVRWLTTVEKGYSHPVSIAPVRIAHILSRLDMRPPKTPFLSFEKDKERVPAIQTDILYSVAEGISKALAAADPNQEVVVMSIRDTRRFGIFDHDYLTSFVVFARDERLYLHLSRYDWEVPKERNSKVPEPRVGDDPQRFHLYPGTAISLVNDQSVAIDWRDSVFAQPSRTRVLPSGEVVRREILMESPPEADEVNDPLMRLPDDLTPQQLRDLADVEEARREGKITEVEYRARRRAILGDEPAK
jgi:hypothetical protein